MKTALELNMIYASLRELLIKGKIKDQDQMQILFDRYKNDPRKVVLIVNEIKSLEQDEKRLRELLELKESVVNITEKNIEPNLTVDNTNNVLKREDVIKESLQELLKMGKIKNQKQFDELMKKYESDLRDIGIITSEIKEIGENEKKLQEVLQQQVLKTDDLGLSEEIIVEKKEEHTLSLENISDFEKDGKKYIKIHYPYPYDEVKVVENNNKNKNGKEIFEELQGTQEVMSEDGVKNATSIFEQSLLKNYKEVKVRDIKEIRTESEFKKLSKEEQEMVYGVLVSIITTLSVEQRRRVDPKSMDIETLLDLFGKKISLSPEENIVIISTPNSSQEDEIKTVKKESVRDANGYEVVRYSLSQLNTNDYKLGDEQNNDNNYDKGYESDSTQNEKTNDLKEEDITKELGPSYTLKKKKRWNESAFINILWFIIFCGVLAGIISASIIFKLMK